jgi:hypothetical protein
MKKEILIETDERLTGSLIAMLKRELQKLIDNGEQKAVHVVDLAPLEPIIIMSVGVIA